MIRIYKILKIRLVNPCASHLNIVFSDFIAEVFYQQRIQGCHSWNSRLVWPFVFFVRSKCGLHNNIYRIWLASAAVPRPSEVVGFTRPKPLLPYFQLYTLFFCSNWWLGFVEFF